ncbi:MAG: TIGR03905 family TSCPD domain-containing protein [Clostridia bacterium]|nr:TIGR03905 family TSCPD domain-containing protein [Clostridia bacterium]
MNYTYKTKGVCSSSIDFDLEGDIVRNVKFHGGCNGNLKAVSSLVDGLTVADITEKLENIRCGHKSTSCAHQLTIALNQALTEGK